MLSSYLSIKTGEDQGCSMHAAGMNLNAHDALDQLHTIQRATITLDEQRVERTSTPDVDRAATLRTLKAPQPEAIIV